MRGELAAAARVRVISASAALISQRAGPLTASPKGEADAIAKKLIWRGCEPSSLPPRGKVAPQGRMRGSLTATTHSRAATASAALISQRSGPLTASPRGGSRRDCKKLIWRGCEPPSLPPRGKVAPQGRMRGELAAAARVRVISASAALISQRAGPLTASPKGEADAIAKKLIWRGCEPSSLPPRGKVAPQGRMRGSLTATTHSRAATASAALISQRSGPLTASPEGEADAIAKKLIWRGCEPPSLPPRGKPLDGKNLQKPY